MRAQYEDMRNQLRAQQQYRPEYGMVAFTGYERPSQLARRDEGSLPVKLEQLSNQTRERILKIVKAEFLDYRFEIKVKNMTTGIKWLLIFLGLSIFLNFDKILTVVTLMIKR